MSPTNIVSTNAPAMAPAKALLLGGLKPTSPVFGIIDGALLLLVLLLLPFVLRASLRLLARDEADDGLFKMFFTMQLVVGMAAIAAITPLEPLLTGVAAVAIFLNSALLLRVLCWVSFKKALAVMLVVATAGGGLGAGLALLSNWLLPKDRVTLLDRVRKTLGVIDQFAGKESTPVFTSNTLQNVKAALVLEQQAILGAIQLLRNPEAINEMTAEHTADLRALDLITDGKMPSPEELKELGLTDDDVTHGREALQRAGSSDAISEQDVQDIATFMRCVRKDQSDLKPDDIAFLIREARKRASPDLAALIAAAQSGGTQDVASLVAQLGQAGSNAPAAGPPAAAPAAPERPVRVNPLSVMSTNERAAWLDSQGLLVMAGLIRNSGGKVALVNGELVRTGEVIRVDRGGRSFAWRLVDAEDYQAEWEAVPDQATGGASPGASVAGAPGRDRRN